MGENRSPVLSRAPVPGHLLRLAIQSAFFGGIAEQISSEAGFTASPAVLGCFKGGFQGGRDERKSGIWAASLLEEIYLFVFFFS